MSIIKDTFFGGAEKKAAKAQEKNLKESQAIIQRNLEKARGEAIPLFDTAQQNLLGGFQGALDIFGQSLPAQTQAFQQGNIGAQQQLLAGLPLQQAAILGGQIDYSGLQPTVVDPGNLGFYNQQLPEFKSISSVLAGVNQPQQQPVRQAPYYMQNFRGFR